MVRPRISVSQDSVPYIEGLYIVGYFWWRCGAHANRPINLIRVSALCESG